MYESVTWRDKMDAGFGTDFTLVTQIILYDSPGLSFVSENDPLEYL